MTVRNVDPGPYKTHASRNAGPQVLAPMTLARPVLPSVSIALGAAIFIADLTQPLGTSVAILYVIPILVGLWTTEPMFAIVAAAAATALTWIDIPLSPPGADLNVAFTNRAMVVLALWVTALLVVQRRAADAALQRSIKDLRDIKYALDQAAIVATTDVKGRITYANDRFCEISKYTREELLGRDHRIINSGYHPKDFIRNLWQTIARGQVWRGELRNRAKDGSIYWVDTTIVPFLDERGHPYQYMAIRSEITERKRQEERMREQAALTRLGEMAAVVAHEVKNPLAGIRGALQIIGGRMPAESRDKTVVGDILARLDSLDSIVQDLLLFARPRAPRADHVPLGTLIHETVELLRRDPACAKVEVEVRGGDPAVTADAEQLQTVFLNLLLNAAQASSGAGRIDVSLAADDGRCVVTIRDFGAGIAPEVRDRIFEPFFTTKHRGTGLGLPTARRVVEMHNGTIEIGTPPGGGTAVTVTLPLRR
jgi:PAS domain S-box-containing protein